MHRVEGQGDNGPATRAAAHGSAACKRRQVARPQRRTVEDVDEAEAAAHLLEVREELRRPVAGTSAHVHPDMTLRTEFERASRIRGFGKGRSESAPRRAWRFERVAVWTHIGGQRCCFGALTRSHSRAGHEIVAAAENAPRAPVPEHSTREPSSAAGATPHHCCVQLCGGLSAEIRHLAAMQRGEQRTHRGAARGESAAICSPCRAKQTGGSPRGHTHP